MPIFLLVNVPPGLLMLPLILGGGLGVLIVSIAIRIYATLANLGEGLRSLPNNFRKLVFCISPRQKPELLPGLPEGQTLFTLTDQIQYFRQRRTSNLKIRRVISYFETPVNTFLWFVPGWLYRLTLKSTAWLWWPLAFLSGPPRLANNPYWFRAQVFSTSWSKHMRAVAVATICIFICVTVWQSSSGGHLPQNPFLSVLGYAFSLGWSAAPWQVLGVLGSILSLSISYLIDWTFRKYEIANQTGDDALADEAIVHFGWIERLSRFRTLCFLLYCVVVGFHAFLVVNSRSCWFVPASGVQTWSERLFQERTPQLECDSK